MNHPHTRMMYQNLAATGNYARLMLGKLERGAGELPQWTNHILSSVRTHIADVNHYLRHEASQGREYGVTYRVGSRPPAEMIFSTDPQKRPGRQYGMSGRGMSPWYGKAGLEPSGQNKRPVSDEFGKGNQSQLAIQAAREGRSVEAIARQYGVPGRPAGTPGWYGQGGVATVDSGFLAGSRRYGHKTIELEKAIVTSARAQNQTRTNTRRYGHAQPASMARKNLREIAAYAKEARSHLKAGAGIAPAWVEHKLSICASQMDAMAHWLENENVEGRHYGSHLNPTPGDAGDVAYFYGYADGVGGEYRGDNWNQAHGFGKNIYDQAYEEGRRDADLPDITKKRAYYYGRADGLRETYLGHLWDDSPYEDDYDRGWSEGFGVQSWEQKHSDEEDDEGRQYGARGGGGGRGGRGGGRGGGGSRGGGRGGGKGRGGRGRGRRGRGRGGPARGGRGKGRGGPKPRALGPGRRHRKGHRRHVHPIVNIWPAWWGWGPYWQEDIARSEPLPVPHVSKVYVYTVEKDLLPQIAGSIGVLGMKGSGFSAIEQTSLRIRYTLGGKWHEDDAPILNRDDQMLEIALPISRSALSDFALGDIGYYDDGQLVSLSRSFFQAAGQSPYAPFSGRKYGIERIEVLKGPSSMMTRNQLGRIYAGNLAAKFENYQDPFRNYGLSMDQKFEGPPPPLRQHSQAEGIRRYGNKKKKPPKTDTGIFTGEVILTGSAPMMGRKKTKRAFRRYSGAISGVGGVSSMSLPDVVNMEASMGYVNRPWRSLQVGTAPVQEYGSMGYGSMGNGSMDQSVQGAKKGVTRGARGSDCTPGGRKRFE